MMIFIKALPLFLLYGYTLSRETSPACMAAHMEFNANQACSQATIEFGQGSLNASMSTLEAYCSPTCRDLNSRIIIECVSLITVHVSIRL